MSEEQRSAGSKNALKKRRNLINSVLSTRHEVLTRSNHRMTRSDPVIGPKAMTLFNTMHLNKLHEKYQLMN